MDDDCIKIDVADPVNVWNALVSFKSDRSLTCLVVWRIDDWSLCLFLLKRLCAAHGSVMREREIKRCRKAFGSSLFGTVKMETPPEGIRGGFRMLVGGETCVLR
jgi:hypothetical protein